MRKTLFPLVRRQTRTHWTTLRFDSLEDRLAPAATSLYVVTQDPTPGFFGTASKLKEYTPFGTLIRSFPVAPASVMGEQAHDLVYTPGRLDFYNGTSAALIYKYDTATGQWNGT